MAALLLRILTPALAELRVADDSRVLTVEEDVLQGFLLKFGAVQDILEIGLGET